MQFGSRTNTLLIRLLEICNYPSDKEQWISLLYTRVLKQFITHVYTNVSLDEKDSISLQLQSEDAQSINDLIGKYVQDSQYVAYLEQSFQETLQLALQEILAGASSQVKETLLSYVHDVIYQHNLQSFLNLRRAE